MNLSRGLTTVVAGGSEMPGGIAATAAELGLIGAIATDSTGDIFLTDTNANLGAQSRASYTPNYASSTITTVAGNGNVNYSGDGDPATAAGIGPAFGIAVDSAGDLFIAAGDRVREVKYTTNYATSTISTVAGDQTYGFNGDNIPATAAELSSVGGVAVDGPRRPVYRRQLQRPDSQGDQRQHHYGGRRRTCRVQR